MGDAAHAVAPHSGQGASMAIEDALVLAACLDDSASLAAAFSRFESLRRDRVATAIAIGRQAGSQKHAQSWLALRIRDLILPLVMPMGVKAQERMFRFRADLTPLAQPVQ
jgi:2-polyprenyl-6-methoxyphenol hydroxylase-like FAD-dependent oxidoreductase